MKSYTADFETATWLEEETYVWAWAVCEIDTEIIEKGNKIETFFAWCYRHQESKLYFHNLKFDGEFIISYLLSHGFTFAKNKSEIKDKSFTTLISDMGQFYSITIYFRKTKSYERKIEIIDSLKILSFSVDEIAKTFDLPISKLKIDYNEYRERGHILTEEEEKYIENDVLIVAKALKMMFEEGLTKMTIGSDALTDYKKIVTKRRFDHYFPELTYELDQELRNAYKGGFTYLNPIYKEKEVGQGVVLDVNSLYPSVMYEKVLPYGLPLYYEGKYKEDKVYNLYIQMIVCSFKLKENMIPTIQIKNSRFVLGNEYLTSSDECENGIATLVLTNVDLQLFFEHYNVYNLKYVCGWKFKGIEGLFKDYIDKWITKKIEAGKEGNKGKRTIAKKMLNSLYGKLATSMDLVNEEPYLGEDGIVHYGRSEKSQKKGIYLPGGCFITAYAREKTIRTSQAIKTYSIEKYGKDLYYYSDTDSIHTGLSIEELKKFCKIDDYKLGYWAHESTFKRALFVRQKCYLEDIEGEIKITCAGMPKSCYKYVEWDKFKTGFTCPGKLTFKHVKGGVKLVETDFTIREPITKKNFKRF